MERLFPDPGPTSVREQLATFDPAGSAADERPHTYANFALTVDGRAAIGGRSGPIGSATDTEMLVGLRSISEAVVVGAGTMRAERYGRLIRDPGKRAARERHGLPHDPLAVLISGRLDLPWDAPMFTCGGGRILIFTSSDEAPPETATPLRVERHRGGIDLVEVMRHLRQERGIRALLCEGGPVLTEGLLAAGLIDELFITRGPMLVGGDGPGLLARMDEARVDVELAWLLREGSELFARYRVS